MNFFNTRGAVFAFTLLYIVAGGAYLLGTGNSEFIAYLVVLVCILALFVFYRRKIPLPAWLLWLVSLVGLLHLLGGCLLVGEAKLYEFVVIRLWTLGELTVLKFDQIVHAYSTGVGGLIVFAFLRRAQNLRTAALFLITFLAALGIGAVNEVFEFAVKLTVPENGVGGYYNNALDLVFNALGAGLAVWGAFKWWGREK